MAITEDPVRFDMAEDVSPSNMINYLETVLHQLEIAQGHSDPEAAAALAELKEQTATLARLQEDPEARSAQGDYAATKALSGVLEKLDERLEEVEKAIDSADDLTMEVLQNSTRLWLADNAGEVAEQKEAEKQVADPQKESPDRPAPAENGPIRSTPNLPKKGT